MILKKDKLQTIVLIALILNSLFLSHEIWVSKKLWSKDYNFFANWREIPIIKALANSMKPSERDLFSQYKLIFNPQRLVISEGGLKAAVYNNTDKPYDTIFSNFKEIFTALVKSGQQVKHLQVNAETLKSEWLNALKSRSLYVDLGMGYKTKLLSQLFGTKDTTLNFQLQNIKEVIIVLEDKKQPENMTIYLRDGNDGNIEKLQFWHASGSELNGSIKQYAQQSASLFMYPVFDSGLMKTSVRKKVTLRPEVLIPISAQKQTAASLMPHNPLVRGYSDNIPSEKADEIIKAFNYNPSTIRTYPKSDNTLVYVENDSTLKIYPQGFVEYKANDGDKGVELFSEDESGAGNVTQYDVLKKLISIIENTGFLNEGLHLSSITDMEGKPESYKITFDYYYNGIPIVVDTEISNTQQRMHNAVEAEVVNGYLKSYRHYICDYAEVGSRTINISMLQASDEIYKQYSSNQSEVLIEDMLLFLAYSDAGSGSEMDPHWGFRVKGQNEIHTVPALR